MNGHTLSRLLRLRQLQHDLAKVSLVKANESRRQSVAESVRRVEVLQSLQLPDRGEAATWLAAVAARQSAAMAVRDSNELVRLAAAGVQDATGEWNRARAASLGLERLEQRQQEAERLDRQRAEQREQDDRSATRALRGEDE